MHRLTVVQDGLQRVCCFEGEMLLGDVLAANGYEVARPCGGRGSCGKCCVVLEGEVSPPNAAELRTGTRLACQAMLLGDARVILPSKQKFEQIEFSSIELEAENPMPGRLGAAVDIGTTTIALQLYDLQTGKCIGESGMGNPQVSVAADVMGRIGAALDGRLEDMRRQVLTAVRALVQQSCRQTGEEEKHVDVLVVTGNTTMLYLLTGRNPEALSHAPFEADCLFDEQTELMGKKTYLPPCMNAFVGADISCAVLSSNQCGGGTSLLVDVGTNGEIALWKDSVLYVTSTAAGPAFEGAGVSCGCGNIAGAIDKVWLKEGRISARTIGEAKAVGLCGSGLIDAIACFLENGMVDETGATEEDELPLRDGIFLLPEDIRAVQLAKAAIAAGIETLMECAKADVGEIETLYIAGGFGSHLNVQSAARIGLIPVELAGRVKVLGNAALSGAAMLLMDQDKVKEIRRIKKVSKHVNLGGNPAFNEHYMDQMFFPD